MSRRATIGEQRWPRDPLFQKLAVSWSESVSTQILQLVWGAFDDLARDVLSGLDLTIPADELERSLTAYHANMILLRWKKQSDGFESFIPKTEEPEFETRKKAPARSKASDFAFVHIENFRLLWAIEAKVIKKPNFLREYLADVTQKLLLCQVAPFMPTGAMLGYLLSGSAEEVFHNIEVGLGATVLAIPAFSSRSHRSTRHLRTVTAGMDYPQAYVCHHMIMKCG